MSNIPVWQIKGEGDAYLTDSAAKADEAQGRGLDVQKIGLMDESIYKRITTAPIAVHDPEKLAEALEGG